MNDMARTLSPFKTPEARPPEARHSAGNGSPRSDRTRTIACSIQMATMPRSPNRAVIPLRALAPLGVMGGKLGVDIRIAEAGRSRIGFHLGDRLGQGVGPEAGRRTRLTSRPTASRLRASASAAAASGSIGIVTSTVLSISRLHRVQYRR